MINREFRTNKWKDLDTEVKASAESLWLIDADSDKGKKGFYGGFVGQVAERLIIRYTNPGDTVLDMFAGSRTVERACRKLERSCVSTDVEFPQNKEPWRKTYNGCDYIRLWADASVPYEYPLIRPYQLAILHPPYYDIIQYGEHERNLSKEQDFWTFKQKMSSAFRNALFGLEDQGYMVLVFGDVFKEGVLVPAYTMADRFYSVHQDEMLLKAIYVKDIQGNEQGKGKSANLWKYRALVGGYAYFKHEYIFVWKKIYSKRLVQNENDNSSQALSSRSKSKKAKRRVRRDA